MRKKKKCVIFYCCCKLVWCLRMSVENEIDNNLNFDPIEHESCASPIKEFIIATQIFLISGVCAPLMQTKPQKCDRSYTQFVIHLYCLYCDVRLIGTGGSPSMSLLHTGRQLYIFAAKISGTEYFSIECFFFFIYSVADVWISSMNSNV